MLNEKKIKIMMDLSRYENKHGKEELKIARYYRSDYLAFALFRNFFLTTLGYAVIIGIVALYYMEYLLDNVQNMKIMYLAGIVIGGYIVLIAIYSIVTYIKYSMKYKRGRRGVHLYDRKLAELMELYGKDGDITIEI